MKLLFLCTGNACRSQMAEGWARALGGAAVAVRSAGMEPKGLDARAVAVMGEAGVDIAGHASTRLSEADIAWADYLITVCGEADEQCPVLPAVTRKEHWPLADPAQASGSEAEVLAVFRATRDELRQRVAALLERLDLPAAAVQQ